MIGVEHVGYAGKDDYQTVMYERSAELVKDIAARHGLPLDRTTFIAHQEVPNGNLIGQSAPPCGETPASCIESGQYGGAGHHTDPGIYWEWCQYMELTGGSCKCSDTYGLWNCVHDLSMRVRCVDGVVEIVHCADTCVVEPLGVNDHCTEVSSSGATGSSGAGGAGASSSSGAGVGGGSSGEGGGGGDAGGGDAGGDTEEEGSCAVSAKGGSRGGLALWAAVLGALAGLRLRSRSRARAR
jgi:hypothetical protein